MFNRKKDKKVEENISDGLLGTNAGYVPSGEGEPGKIYMDEDVSLSALQHEMQHATDDKNSGWKGRRIRFTDPKTSIQWERNAYDIEIKAAIDAGRQDVADYIESLFQDEVKRIEVLHGHDSQERVLDSMEVIYKIKNNELSQQELTDCLDMPHMYIISNAIIRILNAQLESDEIVDKLGGLSQYRRREHVYTGLVAVGHLAIGALRVMNTDYSNKAHRQLFRDLPMEDKDRTLEAIKILSDLANR